MSVAVCNYAKDDQDSRAPALLSSACSAVCLAPGARAIQRYAVEVSLKPV